MRPTKMLDNATEAPVEASNHASGTIKLLGEACALTSVGVAVLRTLEMLLPVAAGSVEETSKILIDRFLRITQHAATQEMLISDLIAKLEAQGVSREILETIRQQSAETVAQVQEVVGDIVVGMQFQDRHTQVMDNATRILHQYCDMTIDMRDKITESATIDASAHGATGAAETILSNIRIGEIRQHFLAALAEAHVPSISGDDWSAEVAQNNDDTTELF